MSIKCGIVGAAGFTGVELIRLCLNHPAFELVAVTSNELEGKPVAQEYPSFTGITNLVFTSHSSSALAQCDVVFLAVPHTAAMNVAPELVKRGCTVVDLSADFRLKNPAIYQKWYKVEHTQPELLKQAAFGLPELFRQGLESASAKRKQGSGVLVGCAGCYPTATSLAAAPAIRNNLASKNAPVVVDAISGVTGAGKGCTSRTHFCFANENAEAYGVATHRHTPEIEQILGIEGRLVFTPHLAPLNRGLLSTVNIKLNDASNISTTQAVELYKEFYAHDTFVNVLDACVMPKTSSVVGTNFAHVGVAVNEQVGMLVAVCAIDNLCKGAAGQALQCANIVCGLPENAGLDTLALPV